MDEQKKVFRKQVSLEQRDIEILDFFEAKGMDTSTAVRVALRAMYESHTLAIGGGDFRTAPGRHQPTGSGVFSSGIPGRLSWEQKAWAGHYRDAKAKGGWHDNDLGWVEFKDIPVPKWFRDMYPDEVPEGATIEEPDEVDSGEQVVEVD